MPKHIINLIITLLLLLQLLLSQQVLANQNGVKITPQNQKEHNLNFNLSIQAIGDHCQVEFETSKEGALEKLAQIDLVIYEKDKVLLRVPLEQHSLFPNKQKPSVHFIFAKNLLKGAVLDLRTMNGTHEWDYMLQLATFPQQEPPKK